MIPHRPLTAPEIREALTAGLEDLAARLPEGAPALIERLSVRVPADACPADVARALERAIREQTGAAQSGPRTEWRPDTAGLAGSGDGGEKGR